MIIVRGTNTETGEVFEITSDHYAMLEKQYGNVSILSLAISYYESIFDGTDTNFDKIEVIAL